MKKSLDSCNIAIAFKLYNMGEGTNWTGIVESVLRLEFVVVSRLTVSKKHFRRLKFCQFKASFPEYGIQVIKQLVHLLSRIVLKELISSPN